MQNLNEEIDYGKAVYYIKQEGVYMFGGKNDLDEALNKLWVFKVKINHKSTRDDPQGLNSLGEPEFTVIHPATQGKLPPPRYNHTMDFSRTSNSLIVAGGRDDKIRKIYNDLYMLQLHSMNWVRATVGDHSIVPKKFRHSSMCFGTQLLIFGGLDHKYKIHKFFTLIEYD